MAAGTFVTLLSTSVVGTRRSVAALPAYYMETPAWYIGFPKYCSGRSM